MNKSGIDPKYRAPALEKGLDILELLVSTDVPHTMPMIAEQLGRSKGEIFRMATVLEHRGYIRRLDGGDTYVVTNRLFELGMHHPPIKNLVETAAPLMHNLAATAGQSCFITVASGDQIVVVFSVEAQGYVSFAVKIGHRQSLIHSGSGRTLLAHQQSDVQESWLQFERDESARSILRNQISRIQKKGHSESPSELVNGILDVSAPIFDGRQPGAVAALAVPLVKHLKKSEERVATIALLVEAANEISRNLSVGYDTARQTD